MLVFVQGQGSVFEFRFVRVQLFSAAGRNSFNPSRVVIMDEAKQLLVDKFRLTSFRGHQEAVIRRLLVENKNALAVKPTGASTRRVLRLIVQLFF